MIKKEQLEVGTYRSCSVCKPEMYDTYIVKTNNGTYEFALFDINGWSILGDNNGESNRPIAWTEIPTTRIMK